MKFSSLEKQHTDIIVKIKGSIYLPDREYEALSSFALEWISLWNELSQLITFLSFFTTVPENLDLPYCPEGGIGTFGRQLSICKDVSYLGKMQPSAPIPPAVPRRPQEGSWLLLGKSKCLSGQGGVGIIARRFWFEKAVQREVSWLRFSLMCVYSASFREQVLCLNSSRELWGSPGMKQIITVICPCRRNSPCSDSEESNSLHSCFFHCLFKSIR